MRTVSALEMIGPNQNGFLGHKIETQFAISTVLDSSHWLATYFRSKPSFETSLGPRLARSDLESYRSILRCFEGLA